MIGRMVCGFLVLLWLSPTAAKPAKDVVVVRTASVAPEGTPWEKQLKRAKKYFTKDSNKRIKVKTFLGGAKGDEKSIVRQCRDGRLELIGVSTAALATVVPELQVLELPFLFDSTEQAYYVLDKHLYKPVKALLAKYGFVMYQWAENGWQNMGMKNGFVKSPEDLVGRRMRSQEATVHLDTWKTFGASPTEMPVSEVLQALQTGRVDGFSQTPLMTFAATWYKGIEYYTITHHVYQPAILVYSKKWFDKQEAGIQKTLLGRIKKGTKYGRRGVRKLEPALLENFEYAGIKLYELSDAERAKFREVGLKVHDLYKQKATDDGRRLLALIEAGKADFKKRKGSGK